MLQLCRRLGLSTGSNLPGPCPSFDKLSQYCILPRYISYMEPPKRIGDSFRLELDPSSMFVNVYERVFDFNFCMSLGCCKFLWFVAVCWQLKDIC